MNSEVLIAKLIEIGNAVGSETPKNLSFMLIDAQDCALQLQRDCVRILRENEHLRLGSRRIIV